ncbi:hypothetical protein [Chryseobacterium sp. 5_R23647]|jgi:hypothetical protein|uniref:hypothetical protein n=1 Tax=Chryseobacterium sp. 5_R23647 TaxID=2258964 RepID=UPI000E238E7F|nr:hypothetical protein [Chryseobacterium sp. 5_R23647]REC40072.1 hypothetical protein DRF69_20280 [Chryseobacterium sp. 5_R23647]
MKIIKTAIILGFSFFYTSAFSQIIIGDAVGTATNKTSVLLEFANEGNKGIILPYVRTLPNSPSEGTLLLDAVTPSQSRVKYYNGTSWVDLSRQNGDVTSALTAQPTASEVSGAKVIIGSNTTAANGVLVLESANKAMVLPMVSDVNNIPSPSAGMMVYVNKAGSKRLAVYNGSRWSFWAP